MSDYPFAERDARRAELAKLRKGKLAWMHFQGSGCLMPLAELREWTSEELIVAILDGEFGPRPSTT